MLDSQIGRHGLPKTEAAPTCDMGDNDQRYTPTTTKRSGSIPNTAMTPSLGRGIALSATRATIDRAIAEALTRRSGSILVAVAFDHRGSAYRDKVRQFDRAIADYNEAIRIDPERRQGLPQSRRRLPRQGFLLPSPTTK